MRCIDRLCLCFFLLLQICGCTTVPDVATRQAAAERLAAGAAMLPMTTATTLPLRGFARLDRRGEDLTIYIEGDGRAWINATTPSSDPTPVNPVALMLAAADTAANVVYLGRPGQYSPSGSVDRRYWLSARFSPEVVNVYVSAILELAVANEATGIHLVGYSGGAAIAALAASRIKQISKQIGKQSGTNGVARRLTLRTVAGNLDTQAWTQRLRLSPLEDSLNPAQEARVLQDIPQLHLAGSRDRQMPVHILDSFLGHMSSQDCVRVITVNAGHAGPWVEAWQQILGQALACENGRI